MRRRVVLVGTLALVACGAPAGSEGGGGGSGGGVAAGAGGGGGGAGGAGGGAGGGPAPLVTCDAGCGDAGLCEPTIDLCVAPAADGGVPACASSSDTWAGFAQGFFATRCGACHVFGDAAGVAGSAQAISSALSASVMPPGGLSAAERQRILRWLACEP